MPRSPSGIGCGDKTQYFLSEKKEKKEGIGLGK
jgi:hypothetical protein